MKKVLIISLSVLALTLVLSGCATLSPTTTLQATDTQSFHQDDTVTPKNNSDTGTGTSTISGIIQKPGSDPNDPTLYVGIRIFLGDVILSTDGQKAVGRGNPLEDPASLTDDNGRFEFANIEPGEYVLIVQVPPNDLFMLSHPTTGNDLILTVEAGKDIDLGILEYDLPLPTSKDVYPTDGPVGTYPPPQPTEDQSYPAPTP